MICLHLNKIMLFLKNSFAENQFSGELLETVERMKYEVPLTRARAHTTK